MLIEYVTNSTPGAVPTWMSLSGNQLEILVADIAYLGTRTFRLTTNYGALTSNLDFTINFVCEIS